MQSGERAEVEARGEARLKEIGEKLRVAEESVTRLTSERDEAREERFKETREAGDLRRKLADAEAKAAAAAKGAPTVAGAAGGGDGRGAAGAGAAKPMNAMAEMMKSPEMREMMKQQQLAAMDMQYGKLFERFKLNDGEKGDLKALIAKRLGAEMDMGLGLMAEGQSPAEKAALVKKLTDAKAASDQEIRTFLNNDQDYQMFQHWEETKPERMALGMAGGSFAAAGEPLRPEQEEQLVDTIFATRTQAAAAGVPDMAKPENFNGANLTPEAVERMLASYDQQAAQVAQQATAFLSERQMEALKALQKQHRSMQEMGLKMGAAMFQKSGQK